MKKILCLFSISVFLLSFSSCKQECSHEWKDATCIAPRICTLCGIAEGENSLDHNYKNNQCVDCELIRLTLDNYEDYIETEAYVTTGQALNNSVYGKIYMSVEPHFEAKGNPHYKYNDVSFVVRFLHYDTNGYMEYLFQQYALASGSPNADPSKVEPYYDSTKIINLNLAGNGEGYAYIELPWIEDKKYCSDKESLFKHTIYEIVNITGTVEEYKNAK